MKIELSGRGTGKTTRMLAWLTEAENRTLVVFNNQEKERLKGILEDWEAKYESIPTRDAQEMARRLNRIRTKGIITAREKPVARGPVAIDNADLFLQGMFPGLTHITMSSDDVPRQPHYLERLAKHYNAIADDRDKEQDYWALTQPS